jgi:hypothetical protein
MMDGDYYHHHLYIIYTTDDCFPPSDTLVLPSRLIRHKGVNFGFGVWAPATSIGRSGGGGGSAGGRRKMNNARQILIKGEKNSGDVI